MWNRSYRWQQYARWSAGAMTLVAMAIATVVLAQTEPAARARTGAHELLAELTSAEDQTILVTVPAELNARVGTLVYRERVDGAAQVIGRVVKIDPADGGDVTLGIRLTTTVDAAENQGGVLRGMPANLDLRSALTLLVNPDTVEQEVLLARDAIWPAVRADILPHLIEGLIRETAHEFTDPDQQDAELFARSLATLRSTLEPLEEELLDRLAKRAWEVIGIPGIAAGIWRTTTDEVQNRGVLMTDWWWKLFGSEKKVDVIDRPFLSEEKNALLQSALEQEALAFWNENRSKIVDALARVAAERRPEFETAFRERWGKQLYDRAILPAWQQGQEQVLAAVQAYAADFTTRRLLTEAGGPRLLLAYALRSSLDISDDPLLVYSPDAGKDTIVYEPLVH